MVPSKVKAEQTPNEEAHWNADAIRVWPLGSDGPCLTLREVATWRAEHQRMADELADWQSRP